MRRGGDHLSAFFPRKIHLSEALAQRIAIGGGNRSEISHEKFDATRRLVLGYGRLRLLGVVDCQALA
ncbi:hypothetical protein D3C84_1088410 [compost metagenome]